MQTETGIHYRSWLQSEFDQRQSANEKFSLRAFARHLTMDPSTLSQVLKGKRNLSLKQVEKLCDALGTDKVMRQRLRFHSAGTVMAEFYEKAPDYRKISDEIFVAIKEWQHFAILELTALEDFSTEAEWVAEQLRISVAKAEESVERLFKVGLLEVCNGKAGKSVEFYSNGDDGDTSSALRAFQRKLLQMAQTAIDEVQPDDKDITSMTMAIDKSRLPQAREKIKEFRRGLCKFLEGGQAEQVYNLNIQLFPMSGTLDKESL